MQARLGDRTLFEDLEARVYLNHAAVSPPSRPVREACRAVLDDYARLGAGAWPHWRDQRERLRTRLATLIGAGADDIGLVPSTSHGLLAIALCVPWQKGDRIVLLEGEFPANVTPWQRAAETFDLDTAWIGARDFQRSADDGLARLEGELRRGARLVAVSAVQFQTGLRMPLGRIATLCHRYGAELCVDAIQAAGVVPLDVGALQVDYLVSGSHKGLMAPEGCGFVYVHPERVGALRPTVAGWLSHEQPAEFLFEGPGHLRYDRAIRQRADFLEIGAQNSVAFAGLEAAVDILLALEVARIFAHVQSILDPLEAALVELGFRSLRAEDPRARSTILGLLPPTGVDVRTLWQGLAARGIACAIPDGVLRLSPHWPNDEQQVPTVVAAVRDLLGTG